MIDSNPSRRRFATQLAGYVPTDQEAAAKTAIESLLDASADPLSRDTFVPGHITVGAFTFAAGHVLLVHHRRLGIWIEPGGHVDPTDRSLEEAAARELAEETGIEAILINEGIFDLDSHSIPAGKGEPAHIHFNVSFLFEASLRPVSAADEVLDARWVNLGDVATLTSDRAVLRGVEKLQVRYRR